MKSFSDSLLSFSYKSPLIYVPTTFFVTHVASASFISIFIESYIIPFTYITIFNLAVIYEASL